MLYEKLYEERKTRIKEYEKVANRTINWFIVSMIATVWCYFFRTKIAEFLVIAFFVIFIGCYGKLEILYYSIFKKKR